jgi:large subunit ribosomal protein L22
MSRALLKFVRVSPTKARLIARQVQGMNAEQALAALEFMPNKAAGIIAGVIASAVANGEYEPEEVGILSCRVDKAAVMKRWRPRARGTASRIIKPTAHIYVEVAPMAVVEAASRPAPKPATPKATETPTEKATEKAVQSKTQEVESPSAENAVTATVESDAPTQEAATSVTTQSETSTHDASSATTQSEASTHDAPQKQATASSSKSGDDLTQIKGIGKVYAGKLNDEGIFTIEDVANMTEEQIAIMEEKYTFKGDFKASVADAKNILSQKEA